MLGNNMFAYCLNNPVMCYDPSGNLSLMTCHGEIDLMMRDLTDFGCGGCGSLLWISSIAGKDSKGFSLSTEYTKTTNPGKFANFIERTMALDITGGTFSFQDGLSLISIEFTVLDATYDFEYFDISSKIGTAEVSLTINKNEFDVGASATFWEPSTTVQIGEFDVTFGVPIGTIGLSASAKPGEFSFVLFGWGLSVSWERTE